MRIIIVTGMSGAGKSVAVRSLEDMGFYCIDNMPPGLINEFIALLKNTNESFDKVAFVIDSRSRSFFKNAEESIRKIDSQHNNVDVLFLDADDSTLIKRFKETRRNHPLSKGTTISDGINAEREMLEGIRKLARFYINTSDSQVNKFKEQIREIFSSQESNDFEIIFESFGFKRGIPNDSDYVFDVRFLPNPFYIENLREHTGNDSDVYEYVFSYDEAYNTYVRMRDLLETVLPLFIKEGRTSCVISVGCTGGRHRSVSFVNRLSNAFERKGYKTIKKHRDIDK